MTVESNKDSALEVFGAGCEKLSIVIPTYNCARYLAHTLTSVKAEGEEALSRAQIIVVDDCSTTDRPENTVRKIWGDRVRFLRHDRNLGPCANFNACLDVAEREWIHLLHGDDYILPGAYREFAACIETYPDALAVFARSEIVKTNGELICQSGSLGSDRRGRINYEPLTWSRNPIYPAGVLIAQRALKSVGKFDCHFSHVQDWNLWWRLVKTGQCVYTSACIAGYREGDESHSSTLRRTARNVEEALEQVRRVIGSAKEDAPCSSDKEAAYYEGCLEIALHQCQTYMGEWRAFAANWGQITRMPRALKRQHRESLKKLKLRHYGEVLGRIFPSFRRNACNSRRREG